MFCVRRLAHSYFFRLRAERVREAVIADEAPWAGESYIFLFPLYFPLPFSPSFLSYSFLISHFPPGPQMHALT